MSLFDANCPEFFALNERLDYQIFLERNPTNYKLLWLGSDLLGAFGLQQEGQFEGRLNWIMTCPKTSNQGLGTFMMEQVIALADSLNIKLIHIAASQHSAPFFEKFGANATNFLENGWGQDMHRIDMSWQFSK